MKKHILFLLFGLFVSFLGNAQTDSISKTVSKDTSKVFLVVEGMPEFPGGMEAYMQWISSALKYPKSAKKNNVQGRVFASFVVEKDGSISDLQIVKSVDEILSKEAIRVLKTMPKWKAGTQNGENVRVKYTLPLVFTLQ